MIVAFTSLLAPLVAALLGIGPSGSGASDAARVAGDPPVVAVTKTADDGGAMKRAKALLAGLQAGTIDRSELSAELSAEYTPNVLASAAKTLPKGDPKRFAQVARTDTDGTTTYVYRVGWDAGDVDYVFGFDDATFEVTKLFTRPGPPQ